MTDLSCARCGDPAAELHHWAPVAMFGRTEAERWPTAWLCKSCHRYWHDIIARRRREDIPALRGTRDETNESRTGDQRETNETPSRFAREPARNALRNILIDLRQRKDLD